MPCNNDKVSFGNEGLCSRGRHRQKDRQTGMGVEEWRSGGGGHHQGDLLHLVSNITPPGNKQWLHENPL